MPAGTAGSVFTLAEKTGWPIEYILWKLPLSLSSQAMHTFLWSDGIKVRRRNFIKTKEIDGLANLLGVEV